MPRPEVEVLSEFGWNYGPSQFLRGSTDLRHLRLAAPFDNTEEAENERTTRIVYGQGFQGWDPIRMAEQAQVAPATMLAVMENRADHIARPSWRTRPAIYKDGRPKLQADGIQGQVKVGRVPEPFFDEVLKTVTNKEVKVLDRVMTAAMVTLATNEVKWLQDEKVPDFIQNIARQALATANQYAAYFDKTYITRIAQAIQKLIPSVEELEELDKTKKEKFKTDEELEEEREEEEQEQEQEPEDQETGEGEGEADTEDTKPVEHKVKEKDDCTWAKMEVVMPPLNMTRKLKAQAKASQFLRDSGKRVVRLARALTDGKVFRSQQKKKVAGTILIDNSGSMGLTPGMVETLVLNSPGTTVAIYSGASYRGELVIVARNGKIASNQYFKGMGGNQIDGPALEWLGRQEEPRVWVSDGGVIGLRGPSYALHKFVNRVKKRYRIKWLNTNALGRSSAIVDPVVDALLKGNYKDGGNLS